MCGAPAWRSETSKTRRPSRAAGQARSASSISRTRSVRGSCHSARHAIPAAAAPAAAAPAAIARFHDVRPEVVVRCRTAPDVAAAIAFARAAELPVAARSGGHDFAGRSSTHGVLVDVGLMDAVSVGPDGVATVGAGARLARVYDALAARERTIPAGCGPDVGASGLV